MGSSLAHKDYNKYKEIKYFKTEQNEGREYIRLRNTNQSIKA